MVVQEETKVNSIINSFRGHNAPGTGFVVPLKWVQKHDEVMYDNLVDKMEAFYNKGIITEKEKKFFQKGKWLVEYKFMADSYEKWVEYYVTAAQDKYAFGYQPIWFRGIITAKTLLENEVIYPVEKYIKQLNKSRR